MRKLAIVLLNYNSERHLRQFLPQILDTIDDQVRVYLIDNGSTDDSLAYINSLKKDIPIIKLGKNHGYAGGYHLGLEQVKEPYWVLLNSDVKITRNIWSEAIDIFEKNPLVAAFQPKILDLTHPKKFEYAGASGGYLDTLGYPFSRGRIFDTVEEDNGQYNDAKRIFWASGACLFIRKSAYIEAGGLDATFFAHMEEIDLCWRLQKAGYEVWVFPDLEVFHLGGGTLAYNNPKKTFLNFRNNLLMLVKEETIGRLWWLIPIRLILDGVAGVKFLAGGHWQQIWAIIKAHFSFYYHLPYIIRYRRSDQAKSLDSKSLHGHFPRSILIDYYFKKKNTFSKLDF
jgi:GT2 family glycosyltransferase